VGRRQGVCRPVDLDLVLAEPLRAVERIVGGSDESGSLGGMPRVARDTGRDADEIAGVSYAIDNVLCRLERVVRADAGQEHCELVAADAKRSADIAQTRGELHERTVAGRVAELIVDLLEVVEVEQTEGERRRRSFGIPESLFQLLVEVSVVAESPGRSVRAGALRACR
jgi:hypothetical protein